MSDINDGNRELETEFAVALREDMMVNALIRIARDLERVLIGIWASAGLLGLIAFVILVRTLIGR